MNRIGKLLLKFFICSFIFGFFFVLKVEAYDIKGDNDASCVYRRYIYTGVEEGKVNHITVRTKFYPTKTEGDSNRYVVEVFDDLRTEDISGLGKIMDFYTEGHKPKYDGVQNWDSGASNVLSTTTGCEAGGYRWCNSYTYPYWGFYQQNVTPAFGSLMDWIKSNDNDYTDLCAKYVVVSTVREGSFMHVFALFSNSYSDAKKDYNAMIQASPQLKHMAAGGCEDVKSYAQLKPDLMYEDDTWNDFYWVSSYKTRAYYYRGYDMFTSSSNRETVCRKKNDSTNTNPTGTGEGANVYLEILPLVKRDGGKPSNLLTQEEAKKADIWLNDVADSLYNDGYFNYRTKETGGGLYNYLANHGCSTSSLPGDCRANMVFATSITYNAQAKVEDLKARGFEERIKSITDKEVPYKGKTNDTDYTLGDGYTKINNILAYNELLLKMVRSGLLQEVNAEKLKLQNAEKAYRAACDKSIISEACKDATRDYIKALKAFEVWAKEKNLSADMYYNVLDSVGIAEGLPITCQDFYKVLGNEESDPKVNILMLAFSYIKIIAPILAIILGMMDFVKAALESDEEKMKKASNNFVKRLIAAIILFIIPFILQLILDQAGERGFFNGGLVPQVCVNQK